MSQTFLDQLWIARHVILNGMAMTVSISLLAILAGSVLGLFVGLALVYGFNHDEAIRSFNLSPVHSWPPSTNM